MELAQIDKQWRKARTSARRTAKLTRIWIRLMLWVGAIGFLFGMAVGMSIFFAPNPALPKGVAYFVGVVSIGLCIANGYLIYLVVKRVGESIRLRTTLEEQRELFSHLSEGGHEAVRSLLDPLLSRAGLSDRNFVFLRPKNSKALSPSVVEAEYGRVILVIPPDFLSLIGTNPKAATAMLAHEIGHVIQEDTKLWLYASAFAQDLMRLFLPFNIACWTINLILTGLMLATVNPDQRAAMYAALAFNFLPIPLLGLWFFYSRIKRYRRRSEELADLASWILTHGEGDGLRECFRIRDSRPKVEITEEDRLAAFGFFEEAAVGAYAGGIHPSSQQRLEKIDHYQELLAGRAKRLKLTPIAGLVSILILIIPVLGVAAAMLFPVFSGAKNAAKRTSTLSNIKQIGTGIQIYLADYDDVFPVASNPEEIKAIVEPYLKNDFIWKTENPDGGQILYNYSLSGISMGILRIPHETILVYDEKFWRDEGRITGFADSSASLISKQQWTQFEPTLNYKKLFPLDFGEN